MSLKNVLIAIKVKIELPFILFVGFSFERLKEVFDVVCGESKPAKGTHNLDDRSPDFEIMLDDDNKTIGDDGNTKLYADSILGLNPESFNLKMLLNPLEEEFDLQSVAVQECNVLSHRVEVIDIVRKCPLKVRCEVNKHLIGMG